MKMIVSWTAADPKLHIQAELHVVLVGIDGSLESDLERIEVSRNSPLLHEEGTAELVLPFNERWEYYYFRTDIFAVRETLSLSILVPR